jgi:hypothetical protein
MGSLVVRRVEDDDSRHRRRAFTVFIDEEDVGRLKRGESSTFELSHGSHTVKVFSDWAVAIRRVYVSGDSDHRLRCGPGGWTLLALLGVNPDDSYLFLAPDIDITRERERWPMDRIYVDRYRKYRRFVLLTSDETHQDLSRLGISLTNGLELQMWAADADAAGDPDPALFEGIALWDPERDCWVADVQWWTERHLSGNRYGTFTKTPAEERHA